MDQAFDYLLAGRLHNMPPSDNFGTFVVLIGDKDARLARHFKSRWRTAMTRHAHHNDPTGSEQFIPSKFASVGKFTDGLAPASDMMTHKYGFIDQAGNWVLEPKYAMAHEFKSGQAPVKIAPRALPLDAENSLKYCLINKIGKVVTNLPLFS